MPATDRSSGPQAEPGNVARSVTSLVRNGTLRDSFITMAQLRRLMFAADADALETELDKLIREQKT